jgi:DNA topoisomerase-1
MQLKTGRFGKYFGCSSDDCKNTRKLLRNGEPAPPKADPIPMPHLRCEKCDDFFLLRDGAAGIFLAASQFPKYRETRAPSVEDVLDVKDQLDPKFEYLTRAPAHDPDGNPALIRFQRKTREQYVMSEVDGKATGWRAFYQDGKWIEQVPEAASQKKAPRKKGASKKKPSRKASGAKSAKRAAGKQTGGGAVARTAAKKSAGGRKKAPAAAKPSPVPARKAGT